MVDRMFTGKALGFTEHLLTRGVGEEPTVVDVTPVGKPAGPQSEPTPDTTPVEPEPTVDVFASMGL